MKVKKVLKILTGAAAVILIVFLSYITNSLVGNPISAKIAHNAIKKYVNNNYSSLNLEVEKPAYNFKDRSYVAKAKSRTSMDTYFNIYYRDGKVQYDSYQTSVLGMHNTLDRLSREYSAIVKSLIAENLGYEDNNSMVIYDKDEYENTNEILKLDMKFDRSLPLDAEVFIYIDLVDSSIKTIAEVLTDAHRVFVENGCRFNKYNLYSENNGTLVMVNEVTPIDIESGQLESLIEQAKNNESSSRISIIIKEK